VVRLARTSPLDPFAVRTLDGVADDWPIGYDDLQPFYEATDRDFGVSGLGGNPMYPPGADPALPPLPIWEIGLRLARADARLGWHWWPGTNATLSASRDGRNPPDRAHRPDRLRWAAVEAVVKNHAGGDITDAYRRIAERRGRNIEPTGDYCLSQLGFGGQGRPWGRPW
jgi:choline dehydrogenase-like flavoprotein